MEISFNGSEYGDDYYIASIRYTNYYGYGDKTEVVVTNDKEKYCNVTMKEYVLDGHLSVDRIIDKLLQMNIIYNDFECEESIEI